MRSLYSPLIFKWCLGQGLDSTEAADIGQDVFLAVFRKLKEFSHDRPGATFRGWLRTVTNSKVSDWRAKRKKTPLAQGGSDAIRWFHDLPDEDDSPGDASERDDPGERAILVARALELVLVEFPVWYATAFQRCVLDEQSGSDVAQELDRKPSAVYNAVSRVRRRLRQEFKGLIDLEGMDDDPL